MVFVSGLIPCVSNWSVFPLLFHSYFHFDPDYFDWLDELK